MPRMYGCPSLDLVNENVPFGSLKLTIIEVESALLDLALAPMVCFIFPDAWNRGNYHL
jgi:hypothetical protein